MNPLITFDAMIDEINHHNQEIEILIPMADSKSALAAAAAFIDSVTSPVRLILCGPPAAIKAVLTSTELETLSERPETELIDTDSCEQAIEHIIERIRRDKHQIILKGNTTSDRLMKGLLCNKDRVIDTGRILSHIRVFESPDGPVLLSDGGINVVSNIEDDKKRTGILTKIADNLKTVAGLLGADTTSCFYPDESESIADLLDTTQACFSCPESFPACIRFPWIGPANIIYKAMAHSPWSIRFEADMVLSNGGYGAIFVHNRTNRPFMIATPPRGARLQEKQELLDESITVIGKRKAANTEPTNVALLDFTEQYEPFLQVPSVRDAGTLVDRFAQGDGKDRERLRQHMEHPASTGNIIRAVVEGPMAFDLAACKKAAETKKFRSITSGQADIFFMPDYTSGVLLSELYRRWDVLGLPWKAADISFGGNIPVLIPSRSDTYEHKLRSITAAVFISMYAG